MDIAVTEVASNATRSELLAQWISGRVAKVLEMDIQAVDRHLRFADLGIDSIMAVSLVGELEAHLGLDLDPTLLYRHTTISDLARFLCRDQAQ